MSAANGRPHTPDGAVYARDYTANKEITGLLEWLIPGFKDSRIGVSGWFGNIDSVRVGGLGEVVDGAEAEALMLKEHGLDAYVVVNHRRFSVNAECVRADSRPIGTDRERTYDHPAASSRCRRTCRTASFIPTSASTGRRCPTTAGPTSRCARPTPATRALHARSSRRR